jgi:hypothetical protein
MGPPSRNQVSGEPASFLVELNGLYLSIVRRGFSMQRERSLKCVLSLCWNVEKMIMVGRVLVIALYVTFCTSHDCFVMLHDFCPLQVSRERLQTMIATKWFPRNGSIRCCKWHKERNTKGDLWRPIDAVMGPTAWLTRREHNCFMMSANKSHTRFPFFRMTHQALPATRLKHSNWQYKSDQILETTGF